MLKIEVTKENALEVLKRAQDGEKIPQSILKIAMDLVIKNIFKPR
jgi:hypothetical protein